jgi:hypothetical protein
MERISGHARRELVRAVGERYRAGTRPEKQRVLDEFVAVTGWHRKHAIRVLNEAGCDRERIRRGRPRVYDEAVRQTLLVLWEASDRLCAKRLRPLLPTLTAALERHGHLQLEADVRTRVLTASAATIDRLLAEPRATARGHQRKRKASPPALRAAIPIRTRSDWADPRPGCMEADLVAHCGTSPEGSFVNTLVLTDVATGWTECVPLVVRESALVVEALEQLRKTMPFTLLALDTDNGSEFINDAVVAFCKKSNVEQTRSRPYRKNDQAWVEQKNGAVVRRLVGYGRLEGLTAAQALARLYAASRLFVNLFQPSFKLAEKTRIGARVVKKYHPPATPGARLLASQWISDAMKERLKAVHAELDPLRLLDEIRAAQHELASLSAGARIHVPATNNADLERGLSGLATAWQAGEVRPTHAKSPPPTRHWRTRKDPFEHVWPRVQEWLEAEPERTAKELLQRLQSQLPGEFPNGLLRTLQRRTHEWRVNAARALVFGMEGARLLPQVEAIAAGVAVAVEVRQAGSSLP